MNTSINFHGFIELYQEYDKQTRSGAVTAASAGHLPVADRPGVLPESNVSGEPLAEASCATGDC